MDVQATFNIRLLGSLLILIPVLVGFVLHGLLAVALYKYMGDSAALYYVPLAFEGVAFHGIFGLSFVLSANRFLLFVFPKLHNLLFSIRSTKIISLLVWIYVFVEIGMSNVAGCRKQFSKEGFYFWYNCSNRIPGQFHFLDYINIQSWTLPVIMIIMYIAIYIRLRTTRRNRHRNETPFKKEVRYLIQTVLIGVLIFVEVCAFVFVPFLGVRGYGQFYLNMILNLIVIANNLITPIVLLSFNSEIRRHVPCVFGPSVALAPAALSVKSIPASKSGY
ncbi:hypothetical protein Q1695_007713 [Nippostrongylus brasiliensis]|nr:hypothetical protein Q1695_007713 [Nippostrongylus brasiliensis]